jgi:hypothetical protein
MSELECPQSDTENSTTGASATTAETPAAALQSFVTEGFLDLDEARGTLHIVDRSESQALAEYVVGTDTWALIRMRRRSDRWQVDAVAWCGSAERR